MNEKPEKVPYSNGKFRYKHYGRNLQNMLKIVNEFDEETRKMLIEQLANHMKISYVNWKNEPVNDEYIFDDIQKLTNGEIEIPKNLSLNEVKQPKIAKPTNPKSKKKKYKKNPKY
jgi:alcohol dehydrogenase class IV